MATMNRDEPAIPGAKGDLLLGRGIEFEGKLSFEGTVQIDAKFTGSIKTNDVLVVGENARIGAEIACGTIVVHGEVNGNIKANSGVEIRRPAKVRGNIDSPSIAIERGALFQGQLRMENAERSGQNRAPPAAVPK